MPSNQPTSIVVERRAQLFYKACRGFVLTGGLFYILALIHPKKERVPIIVVLTTVYILGSLFSMYQAHRSRLTLAVNFACIFNTLILTCGMMIAGRTGPTVWFYVATFAFATFHIRSRDILYIFAFTLINAAFIWTQVPTNDPMQMPSFFVLLTLMATLLYFNARVTTQNIQDIMDANQTLHHTNLELARARQQAEAANQAKSMFLATMSHELRTPLNAVIGYSEMMRETIEDDAHIEPEQALHDLAQIEHAGKHLLNLVSGVLDLTRVESEDLHLEFNDFSLVEFLESAIALITPSATTKSLQLTLDVQESCAHNTLHQDRTRLEQVVLNLLQNAVKFTPAGEVTLCANMSEQGEVTIEVRDTGVGIAQSEHDRIFELFTQVDNSSTREADGAGIGLFLCRKIARRLGGDLTMTSTQGEGSSFILRIPGTMS